MASNNIIGGDRRTWFPLLGYWLSFGVESLLGINTPLSSGSTIFHVEDSRPPHRPPEQHNATVRPNTTTHPTHTPPQSPAPVPPPRIDHVRKPQPTRHPTRPSRLGHVHRHHVRGSQPRVVRIPRQVRHGLASHPLRFRRGRFLRIRPARPPGTLALRERRRR